MSQTPPSPRPAVRTAGVVRSVVRVSALGWAALSAATGLAAATGFAPEVAAPELGRPVDLAVQVRTDPNDPLEARCVAAELFIGERLVPGSSVRTAVEVLGPDSARIRVASSQVVDEPVVTLTVSAGCASRVARRYVLLVDPPALGSAAPVVSSAQAGLASTPAAPVAGPGAAAAAAAASPQSAATGPSPASTGMSTTAAVGNRATPEPGPGRPEPAVPPPARPAAQRAATDPARGARVERARRAAAAPAVAAPAAQPRLRLEPADAVTAAPGAATAEAIAVEQAMQAVADAASAARAAAAAASAAQARVSGLEQTIEQLRAEAASQRRLATELQQRVARADSSSRWTVPLLLLVLVLAGTALWLARRVSALQRQRAAQWRQPAAGPATIDPFGERAGTSPIPFVTSEIRPGAAWPPPATAPGDSWPAIALAGGPVPPAGPVFVPEPDPDPLPSQRSTTLAAPNTVDATQPRDVSIEELIDLEQQAEFFVVLGQEEAAIDLLVEHLRQTGGGSPLPYLKLLEIYGRRNDREAYERMRSRFNRRFNAYAPEWGADLGHGRTLEDYRGVVPRLQELWPRPLDSMAELEALLFRRSRGELFELPAYREVLLLYSVARDLLDREAAETGTVDLLLPLGDAPVAHRPMAGTALDDDDGAPVQEAERGRPGPVDLDTGDPSGVRGSSFGSLDSPATRPFGRDGSG
jgi:pilus assembly protein FimV